MSDSKSSLNLKGMIYAALFGAATAAGAYIIIPFPLVPVTLQTLFLYLAAGLLGGHLAALSQIVYLLLGIIGLPVFAGGKAGIGVLFGPTGGYLLGFVAAAYAVGKLVQSRNPAGFIRLIISMLAGTLIIYICGVTQLSLVADLSLQKALSVGVLPFLPGDAIKIAAAAIVTVKIRDSIKI
jgi:biotin transport system substrate-specific component